MTAINSTTKQYDRGVSGGGKSVRLNGRIGYVDITIGSESSNAILVTFQAKRLNAHENLDHPIIATIYQYEDTSGTLDSEVSEGAVVYNLTVTTGTLQSAFHDGLELAVRSDDDGTIAMTLTDSSGAGTSTKYLGFACGDYFCQTGAITFA